MRLETNDRPTVNAVYLLPASHKVYAEETDTTVLCYSLSTVEGRMDLLDRLFLPERWSMVQKATLMRPGRPETRYQRPPADFRELAFDEMEDRFSKLFLSNEIPLVGEEPWRVRATDSCKGVRLSVTMLGKLKKKSNPLVICGRSFSRNADRQENFGLNPQGMSWTLRSQ